MVVLDCDLLVTAGAHGGEPLDFVPKRQCLRAVNEQTQDSWLLISIVMYIVSK